MNFILYRYLFVEALKTWMGVIIVLLGIMLGTTFARFLGRAAEGKLEAEVLLNVVSISIVQNLVVLIPVSVLIAVMLSLGRFYRDREIDVMSACGLGIAQIYRPHLLLAFILAIPAAWLSLELSPQAAFEVKALRDLSRQRVDLNLAEPGKFRVLGRGKGVFYSEAVSSDGVGLDRIFVWFQHEGLDNVIVANKGIQSVDQEAGSRGIVLLDGFRYEGNPGRGDYRRIRFAEHGVSVEIPPIVPSRDHDLKPTSKLIGSGSLEEQAELQRRIAIPVSVILLVLAAVPLARTSPRQGRYGRLVLAMLVYLIYVNLLTTAQVAVAEGTLPLFPGLWLVHGLMLVYCMWLASRVRGGVKRRFLPVFSR